jgi:hypothetical protein
MKVAIPTYKRSNTIEAQSLNFVLNDLKVPANDVYIFVSNQDEYDTYLSVLSKYDVNIVNAYVITARDKFNYIHQYFIDGEDVLVVEDDVKGIVTITDKKAKTIIEHGFRLMHKEGKCIWGIYPSSNKLFMQPNVLTGFGFLVANIYGFKADGDKRILVQEQCKTDYERSVLYSVYKNGVVRLNYVAAKTNNYTNKGGMQSMLDREKMEQESCDNLVKRYPQYIGYKKGTKSKYKEIKLLR